MIDTPMKVIGRACKIMCDIYLKLTGAVVVVINASNEGISMSRRVDMRENLDLDMLRSVVARILSPCTHASLD